MSWFNRIFSPHHGVTYLHPPYHGVTSLYTTAPLLRLISGTSIIVPLRHVEGMSQNHSHLTVIISLSLFNRLFSAHHGVTSSHTPFHGVMSSHTPFHGVMSYHSSITVLRRISTISRCYVLHDRITVLRYTLYLTLSLRVMLIPYHGITSRYTSTSLQ